MRTRLVIAALAIPVALLSACGDDDGDDASDPGSSSDTPSGSASESATDTPTEAPTDQPTATEDPTADWPKCASVWTAGAALPRAYEGCRESGTAVKADSRMCSFGRPLVTYADRFYAVPTGVIHETAGPLKKDRAYQSALASCTA
jgi:hypothetical protein